MIKVEVSALHTDLSSDLEKYAHKKFGRLEKYLPKSMRTSAHVEVRLKELKTKGQKQYVCDAVLHVPGENLAAEEATINIFAAIDIVERKLKTQLDKYRSTHLRSLSSKRTKIRRLLNRFRSPSSDN